MAGKPHEDILEQFVADTFLLDTHGLSEKYQRAISTVKDWRIYAQRHGYEVGYGPQSQAVQHGEVSFSVRRPPEQVIEKIEKGAVQLYEAGQELDIIEVEADFDFGPLPIMLVGWGDWHLGDEDCDLEHLLRDKELMLATEGLYIIGMGDYRCNLSRASFRPVNREILPPGWQDALALRYAAELKGKVLGWLIGCHDYFQMVQQDVDFMECMCKKSEAKHLGHQATITLNFPEVSYRGVVRHKVFGGESVINTTNAQRRVYEACGNPDFVMIAHKHYSDLQHKGKYDKTSETVWTRSGCYIVKGEYSQRLGQYVTDAVFPGIIFYPDREKLLPFRDFRDGLLYLKHLRGE